MGAFWIYFRNNFKYKIDWVMLFNSISIFGSPIVNRVNFFWKSSEKFLLTENNSQSVFINILRKLLPSQIIQWYHSLSLNHHVIRIIILFAFVIVLQQSKENLFIKLKAYWPSKSQVSWDMIDASALCNPYKLCKRKFFITSMCINSILNSITLSSCEKLLVIIDHIVQQFWFKWSKTPGLLEKKWRNSENIN